MDKELLIGAVIGGIALKMFSSNTPVPVVNNGNGIPQGTGPVSISGCEADPNGLNVEWVGEVVAIHISTDIGSVRVPINQIANGRYDRLWEEEETFVCCYAENVDGVVNRQEADYICDSLVFGSPVILPGPGTVLPGPVGSGVIPQAPPGIFWFDSFEYDTLVEYWEFGWDNTDAGWPRISTEESHSGNKSLAFYYPEDFSQAGTYRDRFFPETNEVFLRYYCLYRHFVQDAPDEIFEKHLYISGSNANCPNVIPGRSYGDARLHYTSYVHFPDDIGYGPGYVRCADDQYGQRFDSSCNYYPNRNNVGLGNDHWYCIECHVKCSTGGQRNGILEMKIDGVMTVQYNDLITNGPTNPRGFNMIRVFCQTGGRGMRYFDDMAVGNNGWIGF